MTCQLLMATLQELLHPPTLPPNYSRVISPANFSCQVFENYLACQLLILTFESYFTCINLPLCFRAIRRLVVFATVSININHWLRIIFIVVGILFIF